MLPSNEGDALSLQILDVLDCTGSGDVDTSRVVKADEDGCIEGLYGNKLRVNPDWVNPSGVLRSPSLGNSSKSDLCLMSSQGLAMEHSCS